MKTSALRIWHRQECTNFPITKPTIELAAGNIHEVLVRENESNVRFGLALAGNNATIFLDISGPNLLLAFVVLDLEFKDAVYLGVKQRIDLANSK